MKLNIAGRRRRSSPVAIGLISCSAMLLAGCGGPMADIFSGTKFSESAMGVGASPRVTSSRNVPKGGGRYQVGDPYTVAGRTFVPREDPNLDQRGQASWYGPAFHGRLTANGEVFDQYHLSAAHPTLPLPSYVRVTNTANGATTIVRVNDRGPFAHGRVIDLSRRTAEVLGFINQGMADVRVQYVGPAPLEGDDTRFLVASINQLTPYELSTGTRMAYGDIQVAEAEPVPSALDAATAAAAPADMPFELLSYGADIAVAPDLPEPTGTPVSIALGTFSDAEEARRLAAEFAVLGAVDTTTVTQDEQSVTRLALTHLREGVTAADAVHLSTSLGLDAPITY